MTLDPRLPIEAAARHNYDDTYSPAIAQAGQPLHYWPNITCASRDIAALRAKESIDRLEDRADMVFWNVFPDIQAEMD